MMDPIQLEQMHIKAQQYLEVKVSRVPKRVLPQQDIFTIYHVDQRIGVGTHFG